MTADGTIRVLLSGFQPFGGERVNPSMRVVEALAIEHDAAYDLQALLLPVDRMAAVDRLLGAVDRYLPHVIILLGEAGGRSCVTPERVAINVDDYPITDNAGHQPRNEPIVENGPVGYFSTLPVTGIVDALHHAGLPAEVSNTAGTFLCNRVFYRLMAHLDARLISATAGFVHLPYLHEQTVGKPSGTPGMAADTLVDAVQTVLQTCVEHAQRPGPLPADMHWA